MNKEIQLIINTPIGKQSQFDDSYIRKTAIKYKVPYITTITAAIASAKGIKAYKNTHIKEDKVFSEARVFLEDSVKSLQEYHADILNANR